MEYKSVKEMSSKNYRNNSKMTKEQEKWIEEFELKIKDKLQEVYENHPNLCFATVYMDICYGLLENVDTRGFNEKIDMIKNDLVNLGYIVDINCIFDKISRDANCLEMNLEWSV